MSCQPALHPQLSVLFLVALTKNPLYFDIFFSVTYMHYVTFSILFQEVFATFSILFQAIFVIFSILFDTIFVTFSIKLIFALFFNIKCQILYLINDNHKYIWAVNDCPYFVIIYRHYIIITRAVSDRTYIITIYRHYIVTIHLHYFIVILCFITIIFYGLINFAPTNFYFFTI